MYTVSRLIPRYIQTSLTDIKRSFIGLPVTQCEQIPPCFAEIMPKCSLWVWFHDSSPVEALLSQDLDVKVWMNPIQILPICQFFDDEQEVYRGNWKESAEGLARFCRALNILGWSVWSQKH